MDHLIEKIEELRQPLPKGKCLNLESHLYGSCFSCERVKGYNQALSDVLAML